MKQLPTTCKARGSTQSPNRINLLVCPPYTSFMCSFTEHLLCDYTYQTLDLGFCGFPAFPICTVKQTRVSLWVSPLLQVRTPEPVLHSLRQLYRLFRTSGPRADHSSSFILLLPAFMGCFSTHYARKQLSQQSLRSRLAVEQRKHKFLQPGRSSLLESIWLRDWRT